MSLEHIKVLSLVTGARLLSQVWEVTTNQLFVQFTNPHSITTSQLTPLSTVREQEADVHNPTRSPSEGSEKNAGGGYQPPGSD